MSARGQLLEIINAWEKWGRAELFIDMPIHARARERLAEMIEDAMSEPADEPAPKKRAKAK